MAFLDKTEDEVLCLVDGGALPYVFDIRSGNAARRCLRIFVGEASRPEAVFAAIFPGQSPTIPAARIARRWTCSAQHVLDLIKEGLLKRQPGRIGPKESPRVYRQSVCDFLSLRSCR